ncbi:enoyl-CoA hydratase/isomerase family protein [Sulfitobacter geojensis]|uniref:Enoyl-CoA hydratase/isomerase family protein n=1 Tax=Sulfitobacter geojensis TaxID=1342299 RepID=A0AAE2W1C8_9RHOB|nr:enoyl-CoA hydratase/isomerase family protein [Sulfitobacter geojensis]MBM1691197.1 enoyl-CoA hydratase/isomerase family protein [Sulfitobacter geojensis]MBM1695263.1 enoyl-CoA hydratase/isomerase family protein [Sulfitobacter geojensis]MBM1707363.1 enoyl-CoA hydratase/isomerase family protein [Sulfitobacter geojensis]MBM1711513.1 enoyl-CoA hydratase/isomerase family protein [Sulfitobacter geojensis]MBM1715488.1 enoyl-CoA hydratase/isomerase family protein [Sulfitobacter geojensis]
MSELIRFEKDGPVGILRFLQPKKRNPYSIAFVEELVAYLHEADHDDAVRAVVMTGGEHFSSGGDLVGFQSEVAKGARATSEMVEKVHDGGRAAYLFRKPLISAVCGVAYGAGLSLALSADIVVAAEDARLCEVFTRVGGCPDTGSSWLLQQRAGAGVARMLVLTGREIDGRTAKELRVVEECVSAEQVEERALEIAREIAPHPMFSVQTAKRVMRSTAECSYLEALDIERDAQSVLLSAHDFPEAMKAFSEKRKPQFKDR